MSGIAAARFPAAVVTATVHFTPSAETSTMYLVIAFPPVSVGTAHVIFAAFGVIPKVCKAGAVAAAPGTALTTADTGPLPIWFTAVIR